MNDFEKGYKKFQQKQLQKAIEADIYNIPWPTKIFIALIIAGIFILLSVAIGS